MKLPFSLPLRIFLALFLCLSLVSCNSEEPKAASKKDTRAPLLVGVMPSMDFLPLAVAQREGYFARLDLPLVLQKFYSANERDAALQAGSLDGTVIDYTGAVLQKAGGVPLALTSRCDAPFFVVAGKNSGVARVADLAGKTIAVSQNTVIDYVVDMALNSAGLSATDVAKTEINKIPVRFEMLRNSKVDATGLPNPFADMAKIDGDTVLVSNFDMGLSITGILFSEKAIQEKADNIRGFYTAYNMGVEYLATHPVSDIKDILVSQFGYPEHVAAVAVLPTYTKATAPDRESLASVVRWLEKREIIKPGFAIDTLVNDAFVR